MSVLSAVAVDLPDLIPVSVGEDTHCTMNCLDLNTFSARAKTM